MVKKILVTGVGICGKTTFAKRLESDLQNRGLAVQNADLDYDKDWRIVDPTNDVYLLQTPHGCEIEKRDEGKPEDFQRIFYLKADGKTYCTLLSGRGSAWFREGVVERTEDHNPQPYSEQKLTDIIEKIAGYALKMPRLVREDEEYFANRQNVRTVPVGLDETGITYENYPAILEELVSELKGGKTQ